MNINEIAETWVNGNRKDAIAEVCDRLHDHAKTAFIAVAVYHALLAINQHDADSFYRALYNRS